MLPTREEAAEDRAKARELEVERGEAPGGEFRGWEWRWHDGRMCLIVLKAGSPESLSPTLVGEVLRSRYPGGVPASGPCCFPASRGFVEEYVIDVLNRALSGRPTTARETKTPRKRRS